MIRGEKDAGIWFALFMFAVMFAMLGWILLMAQRPVRADCKELAESADEYAQCIKELRDDP